MIAPRNAARYLLILAVAFCSARALAIDFIEAAPNQAKVLVDNEKVRIIRATFKKGDKVPVHSHPDMIIYTVKSKGKIKFTNVDGKVIEAEPKAGEVTFRPAVTHSHEHFGDSEAVVIELKK